MREVRAMSSLFRVFGYMGQVFGMITQNPMLLAPLVLNIALAVPLNIALSVAYYFVPYEYQQGFVGHVLLGLGIFALYFVDYFCAGLNTSLVADQVTTGTASIGTALSRTLRASIGITIFAAVTALFDLAIHVANQRRDWIGRMIVGFLRSIWTTATYVIMPSMLLENLGFFDALRRSKQLMENDPTQVGVGVVGLGIVTWLLSLLTVFVGGAAFTVLSPISPILAMLAAFFLVNVFWATSAYLKSNYYTCFYLWSRECERHHQASPALAPAPLKNVLGDLQAAPGWAG
jgi:hypothetical protein